MTPCVIHRLEPIDVTEQKTDGGRLLKRSHDGSQLLLGIQSVADAGDRIAERHVGPSVNLEIREDPTRPGRETLS